MVTAALLMLAIQASGVSCIQVSEDEPVLCASKLPPARSIVVEKNAQQAWQEKVQPVSCKNFILNARQVGLYLRRARKTDAQSVHYVLPESPCHATGRARFSDGRIATWRIDQFAIGKLTFRDGKTIFLYCPSCRFKPFIL